MTVVIGKGQRLVVFKELLTHIPLHIGSHHVALVADIILTEALNCIHDKESQRDWHKHF